jgi:hypothetical protein
LPGYLGGLLLGVALDAFGFQLSAVGQWVVRTLAGEGESIMEGIYAIRKRLGKSSLGMAEAYGWGKLLGMAGPWIIDWGSRLWGLDVYGVQGFYIPYFYGLSDQIGANISGLIHLRKRTGDWHSALARYFRHPVMMSSLVIILAVPLALFLVRLTGFSPTTQVLTAVETIASNLCWIPPIAGAIHERRRNALALSGDMENSANDGEL